MNRVVDICLNITHHQVHIAAASQVYFDVMYADSN